MRRCDVTPHRAEKWAIHKKLLTDRDCPKADSTDVSGDGRPQSWAVGCSLPESDCGDSSLAPHSDIGNEGRRRPDLKKLVTVAPSMMMRVALLVIGWHLIRVAYRVAEFDSLWDVDAPGRLHRMRNRTTRQRDRRKQESRKPQKSKKQPAATPCPLLSRRCPHFSSRRFRQYLPGSGFPMLKLRKRISKGIRHHDCLPRRRRATSSKSRS